MTMQAWRADRISSLRAAAFSAAENLFPGYFALVMATGVISIACHLLAMPAIAYALVGVNWIAYAVLWALTLLRLWRFPRNVATDLSSHQRAPGFFTIVAGTCVLGTQNAVVANAHGVANVLLFLGLGLWCVVMYTFVTAVTIRESKPSLASGINGAWLIAAVATQSIVVLKGTLDATSIPSPEFQFLCLAMFMIGCMLYLAIIPLIFYRLTFVQLSTHDFTPPYWINMGAVAITTLAGSILLFRTKEWPLLQEFRPFLKGFTVFFWAASTWWIPFLVALMGWRYLIRRDRIRYEPQLWGMVFPLGMYTTGTFQLSRALDLPFLEAIPRLTVFVALAAWVATFVGLLTHLVRAVLEPWQRPSA